MVIFLPDAANTLLVPTLSASLIIAMSTLLDEKSRNLLLIFTLVMVIPATLGMVLPMEESQGYRLIAATFIFLGLFNTALTPLLHGARLRGPLLASIVSTVIAVANAAINPLYSEWRPQHLNINYFENLDNGEAFYQLESQNPAPERLMSLMQFKVDKAQLLPFHEAGLPNWSPADTSGLPGPEISIQDIKPAMESQTISLVIQSPRQANAMMLIFPSESKLKNFSIEGNAFDAILLDEDTDRSRYLIRLVNVYDRKIPMELTFETTQTISFYLADGSTKLPDSASELLAERTPLASPVHQGDQAMLFRQFDLKPEEPE